MADDVRPWEPTDLVRMRREREGLVKKRDELAADLHGYNGAIERLDKRIDERVRGMQEATGDG